jgi:ketosteroid isomerase-like protein
MLKSEFVTSMTKTFLLLISLILLSACRSVAPQLTNQTTERTPTPIPANDEAAILQLLQAESEGVVRQDMTLLAELWAEDAVVTDAKHTPAASDDDAVWNGIDAILDRYVILVFPGNPQSAGPIDIEITINGDQAIARSTTKISDEISPGGDLWTFTRCGERWCIETLTYNLENNP